jgi:cytochrome P450
MLALIALSSLIIFYFIVKPIYTYFKDEKGLGRFPSASPLAGISNLWLAYVQYHTSRSRYVHAAHQNHGKIVRIQPSHLSFTEPKAIADIYSFQSGMMKDEFYETFSGEDFSGVNEHSITNTRDRVVHGRKRKFIAAAFAQKHIVGADPIVHRVLGKLVTTLDGFCKHGPPAYPGAPKPGFVDLYKWINLFTYDAIGEIAFGKSFEFLDIGDDLATAETGDGKRYQCHVIPTFHNSSYYDMLVASWAPWIAVLKK